MSSRPVTVDEFMRIVEEKNARQADWERGNRTHSCPWCRSTLLESSGFHVMGKDSEGKPELHIYLVRCENCGKYLYVFTTAGAWKVLGPMYKKFVEG